MAAFDVNAILELGVQHHRAGRLAEAVKIYQQVLADDPNQPDALHLLGALAMNMGNLDTAEALIARAVQVSPEVDLFRSTLKTCRRMKADVLIKKAAELTARREFEEANQLCELALKMTPKYPSAHNALGLVRKAQWRLDEAVAIFRNVIQMQPELAYGYCNLGAALLDQKKFDEAAAQYEAAIRVDPKHGEAQVNLALLWADQGRLEETVEKLEHGMSLVPATAELDSSRLFILECVPSISPDDLFQEHLKWGNRHGIESDHWKPHSNDHDPNRRLRVGYVSADVKAHAVMTFAEALIANYASEGVEAYCYSNTFPPDATTLSIQKSANHWREISGMSDADAERLIRDDRIDILVDLNGHTGGDRLPLFARKPAPIQITYLGYPDTTGLAAIDYRMTDEYADPPGMTEEFHSEELLRLSPSFLCFQPKKEPSIDWKASGQITFGSFNGFRKVNTKVVGIWAEILRQVKGSRLMLKSSTAGSAACCQRFAEMLASHGVDPNRVAFRGWASSSESHLQMYNEIDIALDPFPYNGTTTTCDALWMGVPVVTLAGQVHRARVGVSILSNLGVPELIANSIDGYVKVAADLAANDTRLADYRGNLREMMRRSPLMDLSGFTRNVEEAYRDVWKRWCTIAQSGG